MKTFEITISGKSQSDIEDALREILRLVEHGFGHGANSNDSGEFNLQSSGEYEFD